MSTRNQIYVKYKAYPFKNRNYTKNPMLVTKHRINYNLYFRVFLNLTLPQHRCPATLLRETHHQF
jgi:hypothetical protein